MQTIHLGTQWYFPFPSVTNSHFSRQNPEWPWKRWFWENKSWLRSRKFGGTCIASHWRQPFTYANIGKQVVPGFPQTGLACCARVFPMDCRRHTANPLRGGWSLRQAPGLSCGGVSPGGLSCGVPQFPGRGSHRLWETHRKATTHPSHPRVARFPAWSFQGQVQVWLASHS